VANEQASLPIAYRIYLPEAWARDPARRAKAGVPGEIAFATEPQIALTQIRTALAQEVPPGMVLADAGNGAVLWTASCLRLEDERHATSLGDVAHGRDDMVGHRYAFPTAPGPVLGLGVTGD
jgi:hypothetical protein